MRKKKNMPVVDDALQTGFKFVSEEPRHPRFLPVEELLK
jgi:hypothetical protein